MSDGTADVLAGRNAWHCEAADAEAFLASLPDDSIDCCVTSPPYWGLREYIPGGSAKELGREETPQEYVDNLVRVFEGVRRALKPRGTCFVNLGVTYANDMKSRRSKAGPGLGGAANGVLPKKTWRAGGFKKKDLIPLPWLFGLAAQQAGWWLRNDCIWARGDAMPSSCTDRFAVSHEYVLLLTKSASYFWDHAGNKEPAKYAGKSRGGSVKRYEQNAAGMDKKVYDTRTRRTVWPIGVSRTRFPDTVKKHHAVFPAEIVERCLVGCPEGGVMLDPFLGSGTVAEVAVASGRRFLGCDLDGTNRPTILWRMSGVTQTTAEASDGGGEVPLGPVGAARDAPERGAADGGDGGDGDGGPRDVYPRAGLETE